MGITTCGKDVPTRMRAMKLIRRKNAHVALMVDCKSRAILLLARIKGNEQPKLCPKRLKTD